MRIERLLGEGGGESGFAGSSGMRVNEERKNPLISKQEFHNRGPILLCAESR